MANRTAWLAGNTYTMAYQAAFNASDLQSLANNSCVMSSIQFDFTDGSYQFFDLSAVVPLVGSSAVATGAGLAFWWAILQGDAATYGDGRLTAGSAVALSTLTPLNDPLPSISAAPGTISTVAGDTGLITARPRKGALICANMTGFNLNASFSGTQGIWLSAYRQNLNA